MSDVLQVLHDIWSKAFQWVGDHPKTTIVIGGAVVLMLLVIR